VAKYYYTSGKRKGKVYQEFYYTLNGQQIVNKKVNYCPVNTKWLSKEEFKNYILDLIREEYPNYVVVNELPEQLEDHLIYLLSDNESLVSDQYAVHVKQGENNYFLGYIKKTSSSGGGAEIVNYLPDEMEEGKLYFVTKSSSLSQDFFYVYIKQNGQLYYLGEMQHHPGSNKKLWFKQVFMVANHGFPNPNMILSFNYYFPNPFEVTYEGVWNYLDEVGCVDGDHLYPVGGHYGGAVFVGIFKTGAETYKRIGYKTFNGSKITTSYFDKSIGLVITTTVIQIL